MTQIKASKTPIVDAGDTKEGIESDWQAIIDLDKGIDVPQDISDLAPNDVITDGREVQDEDDLEPEAATLTTTLRSISAEDRVTEEMEEDLDNESREFNKDLTELGDELPDNDLD